MALMDHLTIEKLPICVMSAGGVIGLRMAIQYPERIQALCMQCATTGGYDHPVRAAMEAGTGKSAMLSPTVAYYAQKFIPRIFAKFVSGY